jgi:SOS response regulatory protein OraA/RecX
MQQLDPLIVNKIISFCEYQERCETDVKKKLHDLEVKDMAPYLQRLREARFVDDVRFTRMFISSRHKRRGWGKKQAADGAAQKEYIQRYLPYRMQLQKNGNR